MGSEGEAARALAQRLRALREGEWPDVIVTQHQLASALRVSPPSISSWENANTVPPEDRLSAYATFFASRRSVERKPYRLLSVEELTTDERARRDALWQELLGARAAATRPREAPRPLVEPLGGPWCFGDQRSVIMVCAEVPEAQRRRLPEPDDPDSPYADLHRFADLDALVELHGHIRAANPASEVRFRTSSRLEEDHYTSHLVALGGVDWNTATRNLLSASGVPVEQAFGGLRDSYFEVTASRQAERFRAEHAADGSLVVDVGHFFRATNPFNRKRTVSICNASSSLGVYGVVRALTDEMFRDRNADYLAERFDDGGPLSILMRVHVTGTVVHTPDWTAPGTVLHEWPG